MLSFPLWVVRTPAVADGQLPFLCDNFGWLLAFQIREDAMDRLRQHPGTVLRWLSRREALFLLADMHSYHTPGVCLNPGQALNSGVFLLPNEFATVVESASE